MRNGLGQPNALPHAFAVTGYFSSGGFTETDAVDGFRRETGAFGGGIPEQPEERMDELVSRHATGERIELAGVTDQTAKLFRIGRGNAENLDGPAAWLHQAGQQVHQRG